MRANLKAARKAAGMTQQQVADKLGIGLRCYKMLEAGTVVGVVKHWDTLEDLFGIHQRVLRENHPAREDSQPTHPSGQQ